MTHLTSIRGILAILITLYHINGHLSFYLHPYFSYVIENSYYAVDFFFALSGFILSYNYSKKFRDLNWSSYYDYYIKRAARILPLHIFILILYISVPAVIFLTGREQISEAFSGRFSIIEWIKSLFLIQNIFPDQPSSWNVPSWSISVEMIIYTTLPLALYIFNKSKNSFFLLAIFLLFLNSAFVNSSPHLGPTSVLRGLASFYSGVLVYIFLGKVRYEKVVLLTILSILGAYFTIGRSDAFVPVVISGLLFITIKAPLKIQSILNTRPLIYLGNISFSIYLTHYLVREVLNISLLENGQIAPLWWILLYIAIVILVSSTTYKYIELPAQHRFRKGLL